MNLYVLIPVIHDLTLLTFCESFNTSCFAYDISNTLVVGA